VRDSHVRGCEGHRRAALRKPDLIELENIHGKTAAARVALFHDWWARNCRCIELMQAMNQLLAPSTCSW
jgi:hypothetical protein